MNTPAQKNRILAYLRVSAGCAFFAAAAALAFVAATANVTTKDATAPHGKALDKSSVRDSIANSGAEKSAKDGSLGNPRTPAQEEANKRAYPALETPFTAQLNAIVGWKRFLATSASNATPAPQKGKLGKKNKKQPPETPRFNTWFPTGPTQAQDPSFLTFSGATYNTSGRITALALDRYNGCTTSFCRLWVAAAGGGVWRTTNALAAQPAWTFLTQLNFSTNAIGTLTYVPPDCIPACGGPPSAAFPDGILYAGTGEPNASADSEAGLGIFKSTDGGDTWQSVPAQINNITSNSPGSAGAFPNNGTYSGNAFFGRAISKIVVDPTNSNVIYISSARGVRGVDETYGGPTSNPAVPRPPFGLYKTTNGGSTVSFIWDGGSGCPGACNGSNALASIRGVVDLKLDPTSNTIVYASTFPGLGGGGGVWRSNDSGTTWTQILAARDPGNSDDRPAFDVADYFGLGTIMIAAIGNTGGPTAHVFQGFPVQTGAPFFFDLTAAEAPAGQSDDFCTGQCWYDNYVVIPPEANNIAYIGGSYSYSTYGGSTNGRAVLGSQDYGNSWFDFTWDATTTPTGISCCQPNSIAPNGMHPDSHALVTLPGDPIHFFAGSDGGLIRSVIPGSYTDISGQCTANRGLSGSNLALCQQLLSAVPPLLEGMNIGLNTLQFNSIRVANDNSRHVIGGTQDNGTFETINSFFWPQVIYGDGGQSGFAGNNSNLQFNTFTGQANDGNFRDGDPFYWVEISGPILFSPEGSLFYPPVITDPSASFPQTIFQGSFHVWRTQDWGGSQAFLEANCSEFGPYSPLCGDFVTLGGAAGVNDQGCLACSFWGSRTGGDVNVISRTSSNTSTGWVGTTGGRVFVSTNINANPGSAVVWNRVDANLAASKDPTRVVTGIAIDPNNSNHAWISYSGYNFNTPSQTGHIFSVTWSGAGAATWTDIGNNMPDIPLTDVVVDSNTGDLYVASDFAVFRLASGHTVWDIAGIGMPLVEVPHLTIVPSAHVIYAATHGLGGWFMTTY